MLYFLFINYSHLFSASNFYSVKLLQTLNHTKIKSTLAAKKQQVELKRLQTACNESSSPLIIGHKV